MSQIIDYNKEEIFLIITSPGENLSNSVGISWHCRSSNSYLLYKDISSNSYEKIFPEEQYWSLEEIYGEDEYCIKRYVCTVTLTNLKVNVTYSYKIVSNNIVSEEKSFNTIYNLKEYSFLSFVDMQYSNNPITINLLKKFIENNQETSLITCSGDFSDIGSSESSHRFLFDNNIFKNNILAFGVGDHEYWGKSTKPYTQFKKPYSYNKLFNNPKNGNIEYLNSSYYFKYNSSLFIFLNCGDSNISGENTMFIKQANWLDNILSCNYHNEFIIICMHKSIYGAIEQDKIINKLNPIFINIFDKYHVDIVISGHDHEYSRTYPLINNNINENGTIYLDLGSSGNKTRFTDESIKNSKIHNKFIDIKDSSYALGLKATVKERILNIEIRNQYYELVDNFQIKTKK